MTTDVTTRRKNPGIGLLIPASFLLLVAMGSPIGCGPSNEESGSRSGSAGTSGSSGSSATDDGGTTLPAIPEAEMNPAVRTRLSDTRAAAEASPKSVDALIEYADTLFSNGFVEPAMMAYQQARALAPDHFPAAYMVAMSRIQVGGEPSLILGDLNRAATIKAVAPQVHVHRGRQLLALGRAADALAAFTLAREQAPRLPEAWYGCGQAMMELQRVDEATPLFSRALRLSPRSRVFAADYARQLRRVNREDDAAQVEAHATTLSEIAHPMRDEVFDRVITSTSDPSLALQTAVIYQAAGRPAAAARLFQTYLKSNPGDADVLIRYGTVQLLVNDAAGSKLSFEQAIAADPESAPAHFGLGNALLQLSDAVSADSAFKRSLELDPNQPMALARRATILAQSNQEADAIGVFAEAAKLGPLDAPSLLNWGVALQNTGRPEEALAQFDAALVVFPQYTRAMFQRGAVLEAMGRPDEAITSYRRAVELDPRSPALQRLRALGVTP